MRLVENTNYKFYVPELRHNIWDGRPLKVVFEQKLGTPYNNGDSVRLLYGLNNGTETPFVDVFEAFSPLVNNKATFYIPVPYSLISRRVGFIPLSSFSSLRFSIKSKGNTNFSLTNNTLTNSGGYTLNLVGGFGNKRLTPIPVVFFSEEGVGLFSHPQLNRQVNGIYSIDGTSESQVLRYMLGDDAGLRSAGIVKFPLLFLGTGGLNGLHDMRVINNVNKILTRKLCGDIGENYVQLLWTEDDSTTLRAFWFEVVENEYSAVEFGEVKEMRTLPNYDDTDAVSDDYETKYKVYTPKKRVKLSSGQYPKHVTDILKKIVNSPIIWRYNPYPKYNTSIDTISQIMEFEPIQGIQSISFVSNGRFKILSTRDYATIYGYPKINVKSGVDFNVSGDFMLTSESVTNSARFEVCIFQNKIDLNNENYLFRTLVYSSLDAWVSFNTNFTIDLNNEVDLIFRVRISKHLPEGQRTATWEVRNIFINGKTGSYEPVNIDRKALTVSRINNEIESIELEFEDNEVVEPDYIIF